MERAFQDFYPDDFNYCYGCGSLNKDGLQIKTYWDGDESVTRFQPRPYHIAVPGYVYGGLIASLIDCHCTGTAAAALFRAAGEKTGTEFDYRCLTASLHVDYKRPTPIGVELEVRGRVKEIHGRRVTVTCTLSADGVQCAHGEVVAVQVPQSYIAQLHRESGE